LESEVLLGFKSSRSSDHAADNTVIISKPIGKINTLVRRQEKYCWAHDITGTVECKPFIDNGGAGDIATQMFLFITDSVDGLGSS
jgi:hypothetical protein